MMAQTQRVVFARMVIAELNHVLAMYILKKRSFTAVKMQSNALHYFRRLISQVRHY